MPFRVRKQQHAKVVFAGLQTYHGDVANVVRGHRAPELLEAPARKSRKRLGHVRNIAKREEAAAPVGQFTDVFTCAAGFEGGGKRRGKTQLHRRQHRAPAF